VVKEHVEGFQRGSHAYERGRPSYPDEAVAAIVDALGIGPGRTVVDLAAGTGKFTRLLVPSGATVVAVEPMPAMRDRLAAAVPGVDRVLDGTAESLPLPDASVDAVTVAQAFHWFDHQPALAEIARVLRPGGGLAMLWNRRDESVPWVRRMSELVRWHDHQASTYDSTDWAGIVAASGRFEPLQSARFRYEQLIDTEGLVDRALSISYVADSPAEQQAEVAAMMRDLAAGFDQPFVLPYHTLVFWCRRLS
jgi:ubiquinone/menaquinone biosynthesis C-methylase UbiE